MGLSPTKGRGGLSPTKGRGGLGPTSGLSPNAVELTTEQAWFLADRLGAGNFPWVLAITQPYSDPADKRDFDTEQTAGLTQLGVLAADGAVNPAVAQWIRTVCRPRRWLELRWVAGGGALLRGLLARGSDGSTVIALRSEDLMTCTELSLGYPEALVPVVTAGLSGRAPAQFAEFALPAHIGARADERLRSGEALDDVMDYLGIARSAHQVIRAAFAPQRRYVEIVAGDHRDGHRVCTDVGVSVVDTTAGRILVRPAKASDGTWISTFGPGTDLAISAALQRLTAALPDGSWFPDSTLTRDFDTFNMERKNDVPEHIR